MAPDIMLLRMKIRINIVRCIDVNKIEITVLSARVLDALSVRGLKAKTVREFERYGTRRIALFSHADANPIIGQQFHIFFRTILASSVRMMD